MSTGSDFPQTLKSFVEGTHRIISPELTLAKALPFLEQMGITRVANVTGLDRIGVPVVTAVRPNSRSVSVSQGKGATIEAAKASAVMEAIEGYHAEHIDLSLKYGSYNDLAATHRLVDVAGLPRMSGSLFHKDMPLFWIEGHDLFADNAVWLPYETVHSNYTLPATTDSGCFVASTNGLASGNHILEAIAHGIGEVVERDANTLWDLLPENKRAHSRLELSSVDDALCLSVLEKLDKASISVSVWDITTDTGVPAFYCVVTDALQEKMHSGAGAGCHPASEVALLRALTEAVQVRTNYITGARDDLGKEEYSEAGIAAKLARAKRLNSPALSTGVDFRNIPSQSFSSINQDIDWLLGQLGNIGIAQVIWVDLTKAEFAIPVVRVVIPGLEGPSDHDNYSPGERANMVTGA